MSLLLEIVTPEQKAYSDHVDSVILPSESGEIGILPGHVPLVTSLLPGEIQVLQAGKTVFLAIDKGFAQVLGDKVSVLAEDAIDVRKIDLSAVEDAQKRARKALLEARQSGADPAEVERLESVVRFGLAKLLAKERRM